MPRKKKSDPKPPGPLGFIPVSDRTPEQQEAHAAAVAQMPRFALPAPTVPKGTKVILADLWKDPEVVAELGFAFPRFRQLTGSCVGAGGGNALMTLICVQHKFATNPTKAILPFWPFDYGRCRYNEGDRGQGEGAMGSSFAEVVVKEGVLDWLEPGLPTFDQRDGLALTSRQELQYSDGASDLVTKWLPVAKQFPLGSAAPCRNSQDIKAAVLNGYPGSFACNNYIGDAQIQGSGADAAAVGYWNGRGGHQQYFMGYWEHPTLGPLYGVGNNWDGNTYPADPAGLPLCCCWVLEAKVDSAAKNLDAEIYAFSNLTYPAANPRVLDWYV